ncbi:MAC/perforin domain-containing protein [Pedobacter steynii]|uniref:MACPF domain-containing protein n=1 Tax=Pedobacter steynii TaxID=430522 RepID=A0A1D7QJF5_9SPHI|nr:MAC/perforin domain-containing protein [Pedobacter steynii]AOM78808.1 hypothetical protein BFS30_17485 [Pedobacter steynii]
MKKQTKMACLILAFAAIVSGCKKNDTINSDSGILSKSKGQLSAGDGKWDLLGYGVDVTGDLLDASSISDVAIFDMPRFELDYRNRLDSYGTTENSQEFYGGASALDYVKDVSKKKNFKVGGNVSIDTTTKFTGSLERNTSDQNIYTYSTKFSYATFEVQQRIKRLRFTGDATLDLLMQYLTPEFVNNIATQSADDLVRRYGTHVMMDISIGGRLRFNYSGAIINESNLEKKTRTTKAGLGFTVLKAIGINIDGEITKDEMTKAATESRNKQYKLKFYGGSTSGRNISFDTNGNTSENINFGSWEQSITDRNAALLDVHNSLFLYDFIADPVKKAAVKVAVEKHIKDNQIKLSPQEVYEFSTPLLNKHANNLDPNMHMLFPAGGWRPNGQPFKAYPNAYNGSVPVYQFTNQATSDRFLSTNRNFSLPNYNYDGILFYAYAYQATGTVPIYQLAYPRDPDHFYHPDRNVIAPFVGWQVDGVAFWAFPN